MGRRAILLIIDSFGIGAAPDAHLYGDVGANTIGHICEQLPKIHWPNLQALGLGNCSEILGRTLRNCQPATTPNGNYGVMQPMAPGKDTTTGHWELSGLVLKEPFHTFPLTFPSFPEPLIIELQNRTDQSFIGNKGASGTTIINELGESHLRGEGIICYTSADSVMQLAAHEEKVPPDELYTICTIAREICDSYNVGRVIARPFLGNPGNFTRTKNRRDFSIKPSQETILATLQNRKVQTVGIGKIGDIFCEKGIEVSYHDAGNRACLKRTQALLTSPPIGDQFLFINLVDTDMHFGHRRDVQGYHDAVAYIDSQLQQIIRLMQIGDLLLITADHGCDPAYTGTDHTREYVPLLAYEKGSRRSENLGIRKSFSDVAQSLAHYFDAGRMSHGDSIF